MNAFHFIMTSHGEGQRMRILMNAEASIHFILDSSAKFANSKHCLLYYYIYLIYTHYMLSLQL